MLGNLLHGLAHLVGAAGHFDAAPDSFERLSQFRCRATLHQSAESLQVAAASTHDFNFTDNAVVVYIDIEKPRADAIGLKLICHFVFGLLLPQR